MTWLRFLIYVLKNGSLFNKPVDFHGLRQGILDSETQPRSTYRRMRDQLAKTRLLGSLIDNAAYLKNLGRINRNYFFVDTLQLGYVRILKSASTSVLLELLPKIDPNLIPARLTDAAVDLLATQYVQHAVRETRQGYQWFTIVRNPFQRLVSVYEDLFNPGNTEFVYRTYLFGILREKMSFAEFVKVVAIIPDRLRSPHFAVQSKTIHQSVGRGNVKIFRLEKDMDQLLGFFSTYNLAFKHRNAGRQSDYRSFYDADTLPLAYQLVREDIEEFDYWDEYHALVQHLVESR